VRSLSSLQVVDVDGAIDEIDGAELGHEGQVVEAQEHRGLAVEVEPERVPEPALHPLPHRDGALSPPSRAAAEVAVALADADAPLDQDDVDEVELPRDPPLPTLEEASVHGIEGKGESVLIDLGENAVVARACLDRRDAFGSERVQDRRRREHGASLDG